MQINFVQASPSKNMTVFITNEVSPSHYKKIAHTMMEDQYINAEQIGFIETAKNKNAMIRMAMAGGEFCGNAVLSIAAYCHYKGITEKKVFYIETTGVESLLECTVLPKRDHLFEARAEMPKPRSMEELVVKVGNQQISGTVVHLDGIAHFVTADWLEKENFPSLMKELLPYVASQAIGIIPYRKLGEYNYETKPFVYVKATETSFFERACGSGSLALGVYLSRSTDGSHFNIEQPGGIIQVEIGDKYYISTPVRFTCEGSYKLDFA